MATQFFSTGGGGVLLMMPADIRTNTITLGTVGSIPSNINGFTYNRSDFLELAIFTDKEDKVGIISTSPSFDASPKTITFTIDREDTHAMAFLQRYCVSLRDGLDVPAGGDTTGKEYEDGISTAVAGAEEGIIDPLDTVFFIWAGPKIENNRMKVVFGFAGIGSASANFSTAFQTDNQFTFTLTGAPQSIAFELPTIELKEFVFKSAVGANFGIVGGPQGFDRGATASIEEITDGKLGQIFGDYKFIIPPRTAFRTDNILLAN
jgi:hypothetical protein